MTQPGNKENVSNAAARVKMGGQSQGVRDILEPSEDERREAFEEWKALRDLIAKLQRRESGLARRYSFKER